MKTTRLDNLTNKRLFRFDYDPYRIYVKDGTDGEWTRVTQWGYFDTHEGRWIASPNAEQERANSLAMVQPIELVN